MKDMIKYIICGISLLFSVSAVADSWTDVIVSKPDSYIERNDTIFLNDNRAVAWIASVSNGLNGAKKSTFAGKTLFLVRDVNMSEHSFPSFISTLEGVFDGNEKNITSLVDSSCTFCKVNKGVLKNLKRKDGVIGQVVERYKNKSFSSFVVDNYGTVRNCSATFSEMSYISSSEISVGCIVANNYGEVDGCRIGGKWIVSGNVLNNSYYGGIVSYNYGTVKNCVNKATIDGYCQSMGGIVAMNYGEVYNCACTGIVRGGSLCSGGLVGTMETEDSKVKNSYCIASVDGNGLVGLMKEGSVENCYSASSHIAFGEGSIISDNSYVYACLDSVSTLSMVDYGFRGRGRKCALVDMVYDTYDFPMALNAWVKSQSSDELASWIADTENENKGYPKLLITMDDEETQHSKPTVKWIDVVKERPRSYVQDGNTILLLDNKALAWMISVTNGLNGAQQSSLKDKEVLLMADVDMGEYKWTPMKNFQGTFDGKEKTIKGLFMEDTSAHMGLVVNNNGIIKNLKIKDSYFYVYALQNVQAGMMASVNNGEISNSSCGGAIYVDGNSEDCTSLCLGGIVGLNKGTISGCKTDGVVYLDYWNYRENKSAETYVGGVAGDNYGLVDACLNEAEVDGFCSAAGGIIGCMNSNKGKVINCANRGYVTMIDAPASAYGGGIIGYLKEAGVLANSYNTAYVDVMSLVGYQSAGRVFNCYKTCSHPTMSDDGLPTYGFVYSCGDSTSVQGLENAFFTGSGANCQLEKPVYETTDFVEALNGWVDGQNNPSYLKWAVDKKGENGGYPILRYSIKKDTTFYVCPNFDYYGNIFTSADDSTKKQLVWNDTLYENVRIILNTKFDDLKINRKDSFYVGEVLTMTLTPPCPNSVWKLDDGTIRYGTTVAFPIDISYKEGHSVKVSITREGCSHQMLDTLIAAQTGYDTVLYVCPNVEYEGNTFTPEDDGTIQTLNWKDSSVIVAKIVVKADFRKIRYDAPEFFCANETLKVELTGATHYLWIINSDTLKEDGVIYREPSYWKFIPSETDGFVLEVVATLNGCDHKIVDTLLPKHSEIIEMVGWGDVLAIANPDSEYESYQWYYNGQRQEYETNQYLYCPDGLKPGAYSAKAYRADGSFETFCPLFIKSAVTRSSSRSIAVVPNSIPLNGEIHVDLHNIDADMIKTISVSDNFGKVLLQTDDIKKLDVSSLQQGWYILYIQLYDDDILGTKFSIK